MPGTRVRARIFGDAAILAAARAIRPDPSAPLRLRDVADRLGCADVTISRARKRLRASGDWPWPDPPTGCHARPFDPGLVRVLRLRCRPGERGRSIRSMARQYRRNFYAIRSHLEAGIST